MSSKENHVEIAESCQQNNKGKRKRAKNCPLTFFFRGIPIDSPPAPALFFGGGYDTVDEDEVDEEEVCGCESVQIKN